MSNRVLLYIAFTLLLAVCIGYIAHKPTEKPAVSAECNTHTPQYVALTFDADMTPGMEQALMDNRVPGWYDHDLISYLNMYHIRATLFLTGMWAETYPYTAAALARNPLFEIANHSYSHPSFSGPCYGLEQTDMARRHQEVIESRNVIARITGVTTRLFRFPGGCYSTREQALVNRYGMRVVDWDVVSGDAFATDAAAVAQSIIQGAHNGAIIVAHMHGGTTAPVTAEAMRMAIPELVRRGYHFVTVSEMAAMGIPQVCQQT